MTQTPKTTVASLEVRAAELRRKHLAVKAEISRERKRVAPCSLTLQNLKRHRLRLKDEMMQCFDRLGSTGVDQRQPYLA